MKRTKKKQSLALESLESRQMMSVYLSLNGPQAIAAQPTLDVSADNSSGQSGMVIDINPTNPMNLAGFMQHIGAQNQIDVYHSSDGGNHWFKTVISDGSLGYNDGTGPGVRFDPAIAFDDSGNLFVAYGNDTGASTSAIVARSTDGGASFTQFRTLATTSDVFNGTANEVRGNAQFALATGPDGLGGKALYVAYINSAIETGNGLDRRITVSASNTAGNTFLAGTVVNNASVSGGDYSNYSPDIAVGSAGQLFVVWHNVNIDTGSERLMFDRDLDGRFASSSNFGLDGTVKTFANGSLVGWPVPAAPDHGVFTNPTIDVDRSSGPNSGRVYISYCDWVSGNNTDIKVARSLTSGGGWTEFTVDSSAGTDFQPQISVDPHSGAVAVAYYSTKNDVTTGNDDVQPFLGLSIDGGSTYTNAAVSTQTSNETGGNTGDYGDHIGLAVRDGTAHVFWASRHGAGTDLDAFTSTLGFISSTNGNVLTASDTALVRTAVDSTADNAFQYVWSGPFANPPIAFSGLASVLDSIVLNADTGGAVVQVMSLPAGVSVTLNGSNVADTFDVWAVPASDALTINGGSGNDVIQISTGRMNDIAGHVTVNNDAGSDRLYMDDSFASDNDSFTITDTSVTGSGFGGLTYSGLLSYMQLKAASGNNTINIAATNYNLQLDLDTGLGNDAVNIGTSMSIGAIRAPITLLDNSGRDVININDLPLVQNIGGTHYRLTSSTLARTGFPGLTYGRPLAFNLVAAGDHDWIDIDSTAAAVNYNLTCNGSTSLISVNETDPSAPIAITSTDRVDTVNVNTDNLGHARAVFATTQRIGLLSVGDGGTALVASGGNKVLTTTSININPQGELDLNDNDMILEYGGAPGSWLWMVQSMVNSARNGGSWNGAGITSSSAKSNPQHVTTLGVMESASFKSMYGSSAKFDGQTIDNSAILVKYTYYGDTDFNGKVDGADYARLDAKFNQQATQGNIGGWINGDFDGNNKIDGADYALIDAAFNSQIDQLRPGGKGLRRA